MFSTLEGFTDNIFVKPNQYEPTKNISARKSRHQFSDPLDVKHNTDVRMLGTAKAKCKATRTSNVF